MPYYRRRRGARNFRRRSRKGFWKRKQRKYQGKGQHGVRFFKIRKVETVASDVLGTISIFSNNGPHTGFGDWTNINPLFDSYRAPFLKVKFIPSLPNDESTTTGFWPLYVVGDVDQTTASITSVTQAIEYENMKVVNMYRPWKYHFRCPKLGGVGNTAAVKTQAGGWIDVATPFGNASIEGYGTGFDTSTSYGTLVWTLYIMCKDRR